MEPSERKRAATRKGANKSLIDGWNIFFWCCWWFLCQSRVSLCIGVCLRHHKPDPYVELHMQKTTQTCQLHPNCIFVPGQRAGGVLKNILKETGLFFGRTGQFPIFALPKTSRVRLRARTPPFHGGDTGSNPVRGTSFRNRKITRGLL